MLALCGLLLSIISAIANISGGGTGGVLSVVVNARLVIDNNSISPGGLSLSGSGGVATANFYLLASTNPVTPLTNWTRLVTNQFDNGGNFNFTNTMNTNSPQSFYLLQLP
jgi:hypothetical protein